MHEITYEVEEVDTTPEPTEDDPDPEQQTDYILHITVSSKTVDELAELYNFTQDQKDILHQLLSEEMRPSLLALCGGIAVADGELCWPLPGHTYISVSYTHLDVYKRQVLESRWLTPLPEIQSGPTMQKKPYVKF